MHLTTRGRYAVTAMMDIATHDHDGDAVSVVDIARRQCLSSAYLEKLLTTLRRQRLVVSVRGPGGGYRLSKSSDQIFIGDIMRAINENVDATLCQGKKNCRGKKTCLTHNLWEELSQCIENFLAGITLAEATRRCLSPEMAASANATHRSETALT